MGNQTPSQGNSDDSDGETALQNNYQKDQIEKAKKDGTLIKWEYDDKVYQYHHKVTKQDINCPFMTKLKSKDPLHCKIYYQMKQQYQFNEDNLNHLKKYLHHENSFDDKPTT